MFTCCQQENKLYKHHALYLEINVGGFRSIITETPDARVVIAVVIRDVQLTSFGVIRTVDLHMHMHVRKIIQIYS